MEKNKPTRISSHLTKVWEMVNILLTIQSFEKKILGNEEKIRKILHEGAFRLLPGYTQSIRDSYQGAIDSWKTRISDEEVRYNQLLNEVTLLCVSESSQQIVPETRIIEYDDEVVFDKLK